MLSSSKNRTPPPGNWCDDGVMPQHRDGWVCVIAGYNGPCGRWQCIKVIDQAV